MRHTFLRIESSIAGSFLYFEFRPKNLGSVPIHARKSYTFVSVILRSKISLLLKTKSF